MLIEIISACECIKNSPSVFCTKEELITSSCLQGDPAAITTLVFIVPNVYDVKNAAVRTLDSRRTDHRISPRVFENVPPETPSSSFSERASFFCVSSSFDKIHLSFL